MTVNHGVSGSSPEGGARVHKATEMSPFLLSVSELGFCRFINSLFNFTAHFEIKNPNPHMNDFYKQPKILIWVESIFFLVVGFILAFFIIEKGYSQPLFYLAFIVYVPISQFLFTPIYKLTGGYTYYSPMLLGYMANDKQIDIHSGTSFDYLFVLRKYKSGTALKNRIMMYHIEGLLKIIQLIENKHIPTSAIIIGTSYFFSERTLSSLGFQIEKATLFYRVNLFINFIDLFWMYSLSKGKLAIPALWDCKKAKINGEALLAQKTNFERLYQKLNTIQANF
jgi:hypothetical protein